VLLEGSKAPGRKILISGGGRCNVLPIGSEEADFFSTGSPNVLRRLFLTWRLEDVRAFFEVDLGLALVEEEASGKLFPAVQRARPVRDRLVRAVEEEGVEVRVPWRVERIERDPGGGLLLHNADGTQLHAERVILASGGCSVPKTGSDGSGYGLARSLGHSLLDPYPALVPLLSDDAGFAGLAGIALPVRWRAIVGGKVVEERVRELLITHKGFSGPAVLDASHWWVRDRATIEVAWNALTPEYWKDYWHARGRREAARAVGDLLPRRLAEVLILRARLRLDVRMGTLTGPMRDRLLAVLCNFPLPISGDAGFSVAEVTGGGVPLGELNPSTLESRSTPGLYLCGEILDVIGRIGGYNFLWAWITGRLAGESAARAVAKAGAAT